LGQIRKGGGAQGEKIKGGGHWFSRKSNREVEKKTETVFCQKKKPSRGSREKARNGTL